MTIRTTDGLCTLWLCHQMTHWNYTLWKMSLFKTGSLKHPSKINSWKEENTLRRKPVICEKMDSLSISLFSMQAHLMCVRTHNTYVIHFYPCRLASIVYSHMAFILGSTYSLVYNCTHTCTRTINTNENMRECDIVLHISMYIFLLLQALYLCYCRERVMSCQLSTRTININTHTHWRWPSR